MTTPLEIRCPDCGAEPGVRCTIYSDILGRVRETREPHPKRVRYAKHRARREERRKKKS